MKTLISILALPIMLLNLLGGIVGVIWLMIIGNWGVLGIALAATIGGVFACSFALMPGLLVAGTGAQLYEKGGIARIVSYPLLFLSLLWTFAVMCAWAIFWFIYFQLRADASSMLPMLLVAFGIATGPWTYMAQKEAQGSINQTSFPVVFFLQIACAVTFILIAFLGVNSSSALFIFLMIMTIAFLLNICVAIFIAKAEPSYP